jgi:bacterial/archaeal transporter family protein
VSGSWIIAYLSLKHLPLSIVAPIHASGPLWTLLGATIIFKESPNPLQLAGFALTMGSFAWFSIVGHRERIQFRKNPWVLCIALGTLIGAMSDLYDKFLISRLLLSPIDVQLWFTLYMFFVQALLLCFALKMNWEKWSNFKWRWSIPLVALMLLLSDTSYFHALVDIDAQIGLLSALRRASLIVAFGLGVFIFKDKNILQKIFPLSGVLLGLCLLSWSSHIKGSQLIIQRVPSHNNWAKVHYPRRLKYFIQHPIQNGDIVFVGDSITEGGAHFEELMKGQAFKNRGISGDTSEGVLARIQDLTKAKPKAIFIMIGINDILGSTLSMEQSSINILKSFEELHKALPETELFFLSVLPTSMPNVNIKVHELNSMIRTASSQAAFTYIPLAKNFVTETGLLKKELTRDGVHLTSEGYQVWAQTLRNQMKHLLTPCHNTKPSPL